MVQTVWHASETTCMTDHTELKKNKKIASHLIGLVQKVYLFEEERKMIITVDKKKLIPEDVEDKLSNAKIDTVKNDMQLAVYKPDKNSA